MARMIVYGAGGHARVVIDALQRQDAHELAGCVSDVASDLGADVIGVPVLGGPDRLPTLREAGVTHAIAAVGDQVARARMAQRLREAGFALASIVDPSATVSTYARVGHGVFVAAGCVVNAGASIGDNTILNTRCSIDHDCEVAADVHVSPGATLGGWVRVGRGAWVGIGASVLDRAEIGAGAIVGGGAVVVGQVAAHTTVVGAPARPVVRP